MANATPCDADCSCPICWPESRVREVYGKPYDDAPAWERDAAFDAAYEAYDCDNYPDAACEHEDNEPLFQALMDKVGSYHPEEESYQAEAYVRAAQKVADLTVSVFSLTDKEQRRLGVGPKTNEFIYRRILSTKPPVEVVTPLQEEFICLQKHIEDLLRLTHDKPEYYEVLSSMQGKTVQLRMMEQTDRYMASKKTSM